MTDTRNNPQADKAVSITAIGEKDDGSKVDIAQRTSLDNVANKGRTDSDGYAEFVLNAPIGIVQLTIEANSN